MNRIIKIHGCSGAGKTTAVRKLMEVGDPIPIKIPNSNKVEAYSIDIVEGPTFILGSYENACGGMDTVGSSGNAMHLIDIYAARGNVIFEGLLQSTYYGALGVHSIQYGDRYIYAFLDTPIELCLERVMARRAESGRNNKFNPQLTRDKHTTIEALHKKLLLASQHKVVTIKHDQPLAPQLMELLDNE